MIQEASNISTKGLSMAEAKTDSDNLAFVTACNSNNKNVFPLIKTEFQSLQQSYIKKCFYNIKLIKSRRQPSSLKKNFNSS